MPTEKDLSEREREILRLVATGASNKEIAQTLVISTNTVKVHLRNIFAKIEVTSRTEATLFAIRLGLVQTPAGVLDPTGPKFDQVETPDNTGQAKSPSSPVLSNGHNGIPLDNMPQQTGVRRWNGRRPVNRSLIIAGGGILLVALIFFAIRGASMLFGWSIFSPTQPNPLTPSSASRWESIGSLPVAVSGLGAAVYNNQIFVIGGDTGQGVTGMVASYNLTQKTWQTLTAKPTPVADVCAALLGGLIYVPGGRLASGQATAVMEVYDPDNDTWQSKASLPAAAWGYALTAYEGKLYLFGGWDGQKALATVYVYDPELDKWEARTPLPGPRAYAGAAVAAGKIYVMGGFDGSKALDTNQAYIPERDQSGEIPWVEEKHLPKPRYSMGMTTLVDTIYLVGGKGDASAIEYVSQEDDWRALDAPEVQIGSNLVSVCFDTFILAMGGTSGGTEMNEMQAYEAIYTVSMPIITK